MRVLVACEFSGVVRNAFQQLGHEAWSCDLLPADDGEQNHFQMDARIAIERESWDLMIAHPPCTHLAGSGARWLTDHWVKSKKALGGQYWHDGATKRAARKESLEFIDFLWNSDIERIAIENPVGMLPKLWKKWTQKIQPWMFGHFESKATCLWLKNLPPLIPTYRTIDECRDALELPTGSIPEERIWRMGPSEDRWKERSRTLPGIAKAMAEQWGA